VNASDLSRYPISAGEDASAIHAYIIAKKAIPASPSEIVRLVSEAKPIQKVKQSDMLMSALRIMLQNREHLLAVVDEKDLCVGIITLEDIAGELLSADIEEFR
jgi:CBS domain containing-hemolysin-like protein